MKLSALSAAALLAHGQPEPLPPRAASPPVMTAPVPPELLGPRLSRAPSPNPPPSGHMIDRFVEGLPKKAWWPIEPSEPDPEELNSLRRLNPGREGQIVAILRASEACAHAVRELSSVLVLRDSARRMGVEKLGRLIDLFAGPDFDAIDSVTDRIAKSAVPAPADLAERDRLLAAYPIEEFSREVVVGMQFASADPDHLAALRKCSSEKAGALTRAGLKTR